MRGYLDTGQTFTGLMVHLGLEEAKPTSTRYWAPSRLTTRMLWVLGFSFLATVSAGARYREREAPDLAAIEDPGADPAHCVAQGDQGGEHQL